MTPAARHAGWRSEWSGHPPAGQRTDPQLQRIGTGFNQSVDNFLATAPGPIAQRRRNERAFLAGFQLCKCVIVAFHQISPSCFQNIVNGEDIFITATGKVNDQQLLFFRFSFIIFSACARACEDSSAGMILRCGTAS